MFAAFRSFVPSPHALPRHGGRLLNKRERHTLLAQAQLLPKDVYTEDCPFLYPLALCIVNVFEVDVRVARKDGAGCGRRSLLSTLCLVGPSMLMP